MGDVFEWLDRRVVDGVVERSFRLGRADGPVPGVLWSPESSAHTVPLVLIGHGGGGHKRSERIVELAHWFAFAGLATAAIDGPFHGDRAAVDYQARFVSAGVETVLDSMVDDWTAVVDALSAKGLADTERLGYVGLSMGTRLGLPLVAALSGRFRCAVFGKFGLVQGPAMHEGMSIPDRNVGDAQRITCPLLFHMQVDDVLFPLAGQLALFDAFGSQEKRLITYAGGHAETDPAAVKLWSEFVAGHLTAAG